MGKIFSIMLRQPRRIFAQERAERVISKPKPKMHPYYPTEEKLMKQIKAGHPELDEKIREEHPALEERVGTLRIKSANAAVVEGNVPKLTRPPIESGLPKNVRLLPQVRMTNPEPEHGFNEPPDDKVAQGRILFSKAMELVQMRDMEQTAVDFANRLGVSEVDTKYILQYFVPFTKFVNLESPKTQELDDVDEESTRQLIGHRAFLQRQRLVSELEQRRITARMMGGADKSKQDIEVSKEIDGDRKT